MPGSIRPAEPGELTSVYRRLAEIDPWKRLEIRAEQLEAAARRDLWRQTLVSVSKGAVTGCVAFRERRAHEYLWTRGAGPCVCRFHSMPEDSDWTAVPDGAYVNLLGVFPEAQGTGSGKALLEEVERRVAGAGAAQVFLCVSSFNVSARAFYDRRGYEQIGSLPDCIRPGNTELLMRKVLAA